MISSFIEDGWRISEILFILQNLHLEHLNNIKNYTLILFDKIIFVHEFKSKSASKANKVASW